MRGSPITIKDIAHLLGISKSTVSRALKDHPDISPETKKAVKSIAESFNYRPSQVALSLRFKKSKVIGMVIPKIYSFFFPSVVNGIEDIVHRSGYNLMILQSNESYETEVDNVDILLANNVEGILASVSRNTKNFEHFKHVVDSNIPIVFFDRVPIDLQADMVLIDDIKGAYMATRHLIETGKVKIAICIGNKDLLISINRLEGYKEALFESGMEINPEYIISGQSPEEAEQVTESLLKLAVPPDGIFAISDLTMSGVMKAIYKSKLKVPDDIGVIGFCEEPFRSMYNPRLSSILPMGYEIGKTAAERLFYKINNTTNELLPPEVIYITSKLEISDSTKNLK
jgi:DNA-binding LacI/PurR family transcriptional regulator